MKIAESARPTPAEPTGLVRARLPSSKIREAHLDKLAIVYVRQSSPQQVLENRESTARQYALADYAHVLGWPTERVIVIDEDQGQSGTRADNRSGYQRLLAEVTLDHVGIVLGLEMSRLARSSKDWHHLLELCAIFGALLADQDGVYDPGDPNDRMLLGLKGTMSEVELHTMRNRLDRGRMNKAQRGEMFHGVPMGYVILPNGEVAFDPDEQARSRGAVGLRQVRRDRHHLRTDARPGTQAHRAAGPSADRPQEGRTGLASSVIADAVPTAASSHLRGRLCLRATSLRSQGQILRVQEPGQKVEVEGGVESAHP